MASMAGIVCAVGGFADATCLSEKRARKRAASGEDSEVRVLRRARIVGSVVIVGLNSASGVIAEGAMAFIVEMDRGRV